MTEALSSLRSSKKSTSTSSTSTSKPNYAPSIASTTTSTYSMDKPLLPPTSRSEKHNRTFGQRAKKLWSDIGSSPTADYDRQQLEKGEMTDSQKAFSKMDFPATLGDTRDVNKGQMRTH